MIFCSVVMLSEGLVPGSDLSDCTGLPSKSVILERGLLVHLPAELHVHRSSPRLALAQDDGTGLWLATSRLLVVVVLRPTLVLTGPHVARASQRLHN